MATSPHYSRSPRERERQLSTTVPPYTEEEERWLKKKFGDEYHFLRFVGLDIRRADDRYAGRRFLRKIRNGELSLDIFESEASYSGSSTEDDSSETSTGSDTETTTETESTVTDNERYGADDYVLTTRNPIICHKLPSGGAYNTDWIWSTMSNVHVANHLSWFKTYTSFDGRTEEGLEIIGAGTVELPVETNKGVGIITLRNVVHIPSAKCNTLMTMGPGAQYGMEADFSKSRGRIFLDRERKAWAFLDSPSGRFLRLRLVGQADIESSLSREDYVLRATLSNSQVFHLAKKVLDEEIQQLYDLTLPRGISPD
ncbi:uncharacterized protein DFL_007613 [Arthrobotrys flagrans]|uniref:Retrovirus-related Pol polyprotein from transposon TNT 1-94-like beta-barrel domain-containing protein n=1 Tax=Arthrobotrys flagrans TaxID=97331 RepID=A0A436ZW66_ARTFL|nr:hypothetical protein DFL_007613 [Arthrobotrys flagrans]